MAAVAEAPEKPLSMRFNYNGKVLNWRADSQKLTMADLLLIQYRIENTKVWKKAFVKKGSGVCCEICATNGMGSKVALDQHILGKKHQRGLELIAEFRHKSIRNLPFDATKEPSVKAAPVLIAVPEKVVVKTAASTPAKPVVNTANKPAAVSTVAVAAKSTPPVNNKPAAPDAAIKKVAPPAPDIAKKTAVAKKVPASSLVAKKVTVSSPVSKKATPVAPAKRVTPPPPTTKKVEPVPVANRTTPPPPTVKKPAPVDDDVEIVDLSSDNESKEPEAPRPAKTVPSTPAAPPSAKPAVTGTVSSVFETPEVDIKNINLTLALKQIKTLKSIIHSLGLTDLKLIEYRYVNTDWQKVITEVRGEFTCVLCKKSNLVDLYSLKMHIVEPKHKQLFDGLRGLYHPIIAPTKLPTKNLVSITKEQLQNPTEATVAVVKENIPKPVESNVPKVNSKFPQAMSMEQFKLNHVNLDIEELLKVEYREKSNIWYTLIWKQQNTFKCSLCKTPYLGNVKNINEHLRGKKHLSAVSTLKEIHHPQFCTASDRVMMGPDQETASNPVAPKVDNNKPGKENLVINPLAIAKPSRLETTPNKGPVPSQQGQVPSVQVGRRPDGSAGVGNKTQQGPKPNYSMHPGLQNKPQSNLPTFAAKTFSTKPDNDKDIEGLIGVEYVVKILRSATDPAPRFECCLCETETDGNGMQGHLKSLTHRMKYLDRHFPTCMRQFSCFRTDTSARNMLAEILRRICVAIERYHGRDLPFECLQDEFRTNRHGIMSKVFSFRHGSEYSGPSFVNIIDKQLLEEMVKNKHTFSNPEPEPKRKPTFDTADQISAKRYRRDDGQLPENTTGLGVEEHKKLVDQFLRNTNRDGVTDRTRRRSRSKSRDRRHNIGRSRRSRSRSVGRRRSRSGDGWSTYKRMFDHSIHDLETDYKRYERDPETHPLYQKEWKIFWQKRSDELANDGRDPTSYDFQPEWILFWTRRMDQLYDEEVDALKRNIRDRLKLPYHNNNLREERYHVGHSRKPVSAFSQILQSINNNDMNTIPVNNMPANNMPMSNIPMNNMQNMNDMSYNMHMNSMQLDMQQYEMQQQQNMGPYSMQQNMPDMMQQNMGPYQHMQQNMPMQQQHMQQSNVMHNEMMMNQMQPNMPPHQMQQGIPSFMDQNMDKQNRQVDPQPQVANRNIQQGSSLSKEVGRERIQSIDFDDSRANSNDRNARSIQPASKQNRSSRHEDQMPDLSDEPIDSGPLNVVSVLRLLTALEDNLGILGPRVIDLLAKALTLEKVKPNSADTVLLTPENSVFLETVREKLRGQIVVGVLDASKTRAVNQAIKDVTALLNKGIQTVSATSEPMDRVGFKNPTAPPAPVGFKNPTAPAAPSISTHSEAVEKRELASKLATALAAQGKTNVSSEQLEQLIAVYSLIDKKQRENNVEQKKQSLSDLLVDFLKPGSISASRGSDSNHNDNINTNDNYRENDDFTRYRGSSSQQQQQQQQQRQQQQQQQQNQKQNTLQSFSNTSNTIQRRSDSNRGLSSMQSQQKSNNSPFSISSSYNFGLSNFDTSLTLPSLPALNFNRSTMNTSTNQFGYNRNSLGGDNNMNQQQNNSKFDDNQSQSWFSNNSSGNNRQQRNTDFDMRDTSQLNSAFSTNMGRNSQQSSKSASEMVSYPTNFQRGGGQQPTRNIGGGNNTAAPVNQQTPIGWQQNRNNNNNNVARNQIRGRR